MLSELCSGSCTEQGQTTRRRFGPACPYRTGNRKGLQHSNLRGASVFDEYFDSEVGISAQAAGARLPRFVIQLVFKDMVDLRRPFVVIVEDYDDSREIFAECFALTKPVDLQHLTTLLNSSLATDRDRTPAAQR